MWIRSHLKNVFWPDLCVGLSVQLLKIQHQCSCGLKREPALILNQKWFPEDFNKDIVGFVSAYARGDFKQKIEDSKETIKIKYQPYDWSLNAD